MTPVESGELIRVLSRVGAAVDHQPGRPGTPEVLEHCADILEGQVNPAVFAQDEIRPRQWILREVRDHESDPGLGETDAVGLDHTCNDIGAHVLDTFKIDQAHPVPVTTGRVEKGLDVQSLEQLSQVRPHIWRFGYF